MKYQIGDEFKVVITDIDDSGMGRMYYLNDCIGVTEKQLDKLETVDVPFEGVVKKPERKEYTLDGLREKIFRLSKMLAKSIEAYENMKMGIEAVSNDIDNTVSAYETTDS